MIAIIILTLLALVFLIFMRGYNYIAYTLLFAAFLVAAFTYFPPLAKKIIAAFTAIGLIYFCIAEAPVLANRKTDADSSRSYLIVLGAAVHGDSPSLSLLHRLQSALDYMRENPDSIAVVSGGKGKDENISEAECMKTWLVENGISQDRILEEDKSTSTIENLRFSKIIIEKNGGNINDVALLSSPYHLYRAKCMAKSVGYGNVAGVACIYGYPIYTVGMFIREAFGVTHMWVFGE